MDFKTSEKYFGVTLPNILEVGNVGEIWNLSYSTDGEKFSGALVEIRKSTSKPYLESTKLVQRNTTVERADAYFPCYMAVLCSISPYLPPNEYDDLIRLAMRFQAGDESLIIISMSSTESNCQSWLDFAKEYGATILETVRPRRTVYTIMFQGKGE